MNRVHLSWLRALVLCALLVGCRGPAPQPQPTEHSAHGESFWRSAAQPYRGTVLRGISEDSPPSLYVRDVLAPAFEEETGIAIELAVDENSTIERAIQQGGDGYDFAYIEQDVIYGYLEKEWLVSLSWLMQKNPHLVSPSFNPSNFTDFVEAFRHPQSGELYGVPIEAFIKVYLYRRDLFEDPAIRATFLQQYHYPLSPAVNFQQYRDIAAFFTDYGRSNELDLWGTTVQAAEKQYASFYEFFETIAPSFGVYNWGISLDTQRATSANGGSLDGPTAREALQFWLDMLAYAPPEAMESTWQGVSDSFAAGRAAQAWVYGEHVAGLATDPSYSQVVGRVGVALPPAARSVVEDASVGAGYLGYYDGAAFGIPVGSRHQEAALLWLQWLAQPSVQPEWAIKSGRVVHLSTFDDSLVLQQDQRLDGYYGLMKSRGYLFAGAPPFPYHAAVRDVVAPYIHRAVRGELTADEALTRAARAVDQKLIELGYAQPDPADSTLLSTDPPLMIVPTR